MLLSAPAIAQDKDPEPKPRPPLEAKLVAAKTTYQLDLGGATADDFKKSIEAGSKKGERLPPTPAVDLMLELTNTTDKDLTFHHKGDPGQIELELKGKGAIMAKPRLAFTTDFRLPSSMTLEPGKKTTIKISSLTYGFRGASQMAYWTEPGEYTLTVKFHTSIKPAPKGTKAGQDGFARTIVASEPIKVTVEEKKK